MNGYRSVYNDSACRQVSTQVHEVGHNLNLNHSGQGNSEYGDKSCMVSYRHNDVLQFVVLIAPANICS